MSYYRKLIGGAFPVEIFQANGTVGINVRAIDYPPVVGTNHYVIYYKNLTTNAVMEVVSPTIYQSIPISIRNYNVNYEVKAAAVIDGVQFPYLGATKTIKMQDAALIKVAQCGQVLNNTNSLTAAFPANVIEYTFRCKPVGGGTYYYKTQTSAYTGLSSFTGMTITPSTNYLISVSWTYYDPITSSIITVPYGEECTVTSKA